MEDDREGLRREKLSEETLLRQKDKADRRRRSEIAIIYQFYSQVLVHPSINIMRQKKISRPIQKSDEFTIWRT